MRRNGHIVAARASKTGIEIRCGLCAAWWPATEEFYRLPTRCIACSGDVRRRIVAPPPWSPKWTYAELARIRDDLPFHSVTGPLRLAIRRAYWREFKRAKRVST